MKLCEVIKYEGPNDVFVWKHPSEDFNTLSQLIVHETQEAIFFANGQALDLFGPGRHTLKTQNIPFIKAIRNIPTDGVTPFHCEVYYINKVEQMEMLWGTDSRIPIMDPVYHVPLPVGASGQMSVKIDDARKFLLKLVGTETQCTKEHLTKYFRGLLMTRIKDYLAKILIGSQISILQVYAYLNELSDALKNQLEADFKDYGISLTKFFVTTIMIPEEDENYKKVNSMYAEKQSEIIGAEGRKTRREIEGYSWHEEQAYDVAKTAAGNEGTSGNIMGAGMGIGMGLPMGGALGSITQKAMEPIFKPIQASSPFAPQKPPVAPIAPIYAESQKTVSKCPKCSENVDAKFKVCPYCGETLTNENCKKCGEKLEPKFKLCPYCGEQR